MKNSIFGLFLLLGLMPKLMAQPVNIPAGTAITLMTAQMLRSDQLIAGQVIQLMVKSVISINGKAAILAGAPAEGRVVAVSPADSTQNASITIIAESCTDVAGNSIVLHTTQYTVKAQRPFTPADIQLGFTIRAFAAGPKHTPEVAAAALDSLKTREPESAGILAAGTMVVLQIGGEIILDSAEPDQEIRMRVRDVVVNEHGVKVILPHAPATGRIKAIDDETIYIEAVSVVTKNGITLPIESDQSAVIRLNKKKKSIPQVMDEVLVAYVKKM